MKIRNITSLAGAAFGIAYTAYGMYGAYRTSEVVQTESMKLLEGLVLCAFTVPFGAVIGLGLGLLLEGLVSSVKGSPKENDKNGKQPPETVENDPQG